MNNKSIFGKICIVFTTILLLFLAFEALIRIWIFFDNQKSFKEAIKKLPVITNGSRVALGGMIQPSMNKKIIYELRPGITVYFCNSLVKINKQGWRSDKDFTLEKDPNTVRIIGAGDSFMFGQAVNQGKNAMSLLEQELNRRFPQKKWEVINTAVPGYNTVMEVETLKEKALKYKPDIVIIQFIGNDFDLPNFIYGSYDCLDMKRSYFIEFLAKRLKIITRKFILTDAPMSSEMSFEGDPAKVPQEYRDMVGWGAYKDALMTLRQMQVAYGFDVINFLTTDAQRDNVFNLSRQLGFYTVYNRYNPLHVIKDEGHTSETGHREALEQLIKFMYKEGIISKHLKAKQH